MQNKINVLLTGCGSPGGPGIIKSLELDDNINVHAVDADSNATGRLLSSNFFKIPRADNAKFIDELLKICKKLEINVILPLVTMELLKLSKHIKFFEDIGVKVIVSNFNALTIVNNKCKLYQHLDKKNIDVPSFKFVDSVDKFSKVSESLGYPKKAIVMKACMGNGGRGIRILDSKKNMFNLLFKEKPNSMYTTLESILDIIDNKQIPEVMLTEYLPGEELTIDTFVENGLMKIILIRTRDTTNNGISTSGRFINSVEVKKYISSIVQSLPGLYGPIGFQVKKSVDGKYKLLESNPRMQGTTVAAIGLGVNLPVIAIYSAIGRSLPKLGKDSGVGFARYYQEIFYEC